MGRKNVDSILKTVYNKDNSNFWADAEMWGVWNATFFDGRISTVEGKE